MESDSHRHSNQPILIFLLTIQKKIVSILSIILRPFLKIITFIKSNILKKENGKVSEEYIKSLIEDVNRSYNQIKNFNYKEV